MRAVVQRVSDACVTIDGRGHSAIAHGLLLYLGVNREDGDTDIAYLVDKVRHLRIFPDAAGKMNLDVGQVAGGVLVVSAFTVEGDARHGRRPTFESAAAPDRALVLYEDFCAALERTGVTVARGSFGADMQVRSTNAGPVCILLESRRVF